MTPTPAEASPADEPAAPADDHDRSGGSASPADPAGSGSPRVGVLERWAPVGGPVLLALVLRLWRVGQESLRVDEAWSSWVAAQGPVEAVRVVAKHDTHPPLSYVLQSLWRVFGDSNTAIRSLSVLASVLTVAVVVLIGQRLSGTRVGVSAGLVLAVSPWHVLHANDARMYTLGGLFIALTLLGACRLLAEDDPPPRVATLVLYGGGALGTLYTLSIGAVTVAAIAAFVTVALWLQRDEAPWRDWILANAVVALGWALWLPAFLGQYRRVDEGVAWTTPPSADQLHAMLRAPWVWAHDGAPAWLGLWVDVFIVTLIVLGAVHLGRRGWLLATVLVTWPLVAVLFSSVQPILIDRVLLPSSVAAYPLLAAGVWSLGRRAGLVGTAALMALALPGLLAYPDYRLSEFERAADIVEAGSTGDSVVVFASNFSQFGIDHYADLDARRVGLPHDFLDDPNGPTVVTTESVDALVGQLDGVDDVWLVYTRQASADPDRLADAALRGVLVPTECTTLRGIELIHYTREGPPDPTCRPLAPPS